MSDIIPYNNKLVPLPFGFRNMGATCYFNSLLQALLSCTSVTEVFLDTGSAEEYAKNPVSEVYCEIINAMFSKDQKISTLAPKLWKRVFQYASKRKDNIKFSSGQQDANEGFHMFIDSIDKLSEIQQLFNHRYESKIKCEECKKWVSVKKNEYYVFDVEPESKNSIQDMLTCYTSSVDADYKCPDCGVKKERLRIDRLTMVPEILIVLSKKYDARGRKLNVVTDFPKELYFKGRSGKLVYEAVAQVEHSGTMSGGHYWAVCRRRGGWFILNDMGVQPGKFGPTVNTYMVFYHKI